MYGWPSGPQRHHTKERTSSFEMSQEATGPPASTLHRNSSSPLFHQNHPSIPSSDRPGRSLGTRRTVHPHNPPMDRFFPPLSDLHGVFRSNPPPPLEHRASQTLIDLTEENDGPAEEHTRPQRRPHGIRNIDLDGADVIDLTDDNDIEITRVASRSLPSINDLAPNYPRTRTPALSRRRPLHMPQEPARNINRVFGNPNLANFRVTANQNGLIIEPPQAFLEHMHLLEHAQELFGHVDHQNQQAAPNHSRPGHVPPPAAKEGFTRSPAEEDVVICPSCEEELIHDKDPDELVLKKGGKAPTRKEREEHPFWVVKNCGHVYCNRCYQNRLPSKQQPEIVRFREKISNARGYSKTAIPLCSVAECQSEVKTKDRWVGVFI